MPRDTRNHAGANRTEASESQANVVDAARHHIGRTLESDPEYNDQPSRALAPEAGLIDPHGNDLSASPDLRDTTQRLRDTTNEPLRTRLPGDTSSDPHTDLGPDNATVVQQRGEGKPKKSSGRK